MSPPDISAIADFHAHVYYDAATKPVAERLRALAEARFAPERGTAFGRWHDAPVGPHPTGSFQIAFAPELFGEIVPWLALNRDGLTVFIHPNTGDDPPDHRDRAMWLGPQATLDLDKLK
ncbi:MAG: DOPA 4,5-dioxygenase family protein [Kiloniellaceae bacterium]